MSPPGIVFITGGTSGIGRCTAALFARAGWHVGLIARGTAGLAATAAEISQSGAKVATAIADVAEATVLQRAAEDLVAVLGRPTVWVNCAGNGVYGRFGDIPAAEYDRVTAVTYTGTVNGCRTALTLMAGRPGTLVNVGSATAFHGLPLITSYSGAKAAVRCFGQALRAELRIAGSPIRVSTLFPPAINTPFFSHAVSHMGFPARPARPVYQPEIVAAAIWLAARRGTPELLVSTTVVAFGLAQRLAPWSVAWAMTRLGFDSQLTRDPGAASAEHPTLFEPACKASPVHGPFGKGSRSFSLQMTLLGLLTRSRPP